MNQSELVLSSYVSVLVEKIDVALAALYRAHEEADGPECLGWIKVAIDELSLDSDEEE
jgi:hypothetical protein